jgi:hypothetical protein
MNCDCEVRVFSPTTANQPAALIRTYELEGFASYSVKNQYRCRKSCEREFYKDMPSDRLSALLVSYSQQLIEEGSLGFNCTGLTTLKYPVRVKAKISAFALGNVVDIVQVVNHEEVCFKP